MDRQPRPYRPRVARVTRLEDRLVPSGAVSLVSRAEPSLVSDSAGGSSTQQFTSTGKPDARRISADGRYSVFTSTAANVVAGQVDPNNDSDVFLYDRVLDRTVLVSCAAAGAATAGGAASRNPSVSADGRFVAFESLAPDLVVGFADGNGASEADVFLFDSLSGTTALVSHAVGTAVVGSNGLSQGAVVCDGGQAVVFTSSATNLVAGYSNTAKGQVSDALVYDRATGAVTLASHPPGLSATGSAGRSTAFDVSADGRYAVFSSAAINLPGTGQTGYERVFLYDRLTDALTLVSHATGSPAVGGDGHSEWPVISADGSFVAYWSAATDLVPGYAGPAGARQVYLYDRAADTTVLVSHGAGPNAGVANSFIDPLAVSADGRHVAYTNSAADLVPGFTDGNGTDVRDGRDVYLYDRQGGGNILVSRAGGSPTAGGGGGSYTPALSADGRYVAFASAAADLAAGFIDRNGPGSAGTDVFLFDAMTGSVSVVSRTPLAPLAGGLGTSTAPAVSAGGEFVVFRTAASDLVAGAYDANDLTDVILFASSDCQSVLVSRRFGGSSSSAGGVSASLVTLPNLTAEGSRRQLSIDNRFVAFASTAINVAVGQSDSNHAVDVFLHDRMLNTTTLVSHAASSSAGAGNAGSTAPVISADGRFVYFDSLATDLVAGFVDGNGPDSADLYVFDRISGSVTLVSHAAGSPLVGGNKATGAANFLNYYQPAVSADGRYVAFTSFATDMIPGFVDANGVTSLAADLYVFDRLTGLIELISHSTSGPAIGGNNATYHPPAISADGRIVLFTSRSTDLAAGVSDLNGGFDVFLYDRTAETATLVSHSGGSSAEAGNGPCTAEPGPWLSADGRFVVYTSLADNLVAGGTDVNAGHDVFLYDRLSGSNSYVGHKMGVVNVAGNRSSVRPAISDDGRYVTFASQSTDLVPAFVDGNGIDNVATNAADIYLFDRLTGEVNLVSGVNGSKVAGSNEDNFEPAVSNDGRFVAFSSKSSDLVPSFVAGKAANGRNIFLHDRIATKTHLVSHVPGAAAYAGNDSSNGPVLSADGSVVYFLSNADNLVAADFNGQKDVFAYSNLSTVTNVSVGGNSAQRSVVRSVTVTFDRPVHFVGDPALAFVLTRDGSPGGLALSADVPAGPAAAVTLTFAGPLSEFGSLIDGTYKLTVVAGQVAGPGPLDGNNDGVGGDDFTFTFHRLFGDADGDRDADAVDFAALRLAFGTPSLAFDFDGDGDADAADFFQFRRRFGSTLP